MTTIRRLMRQANPVPEPPAGDDALSRRAVEELEALVSTRTEQESSPKQGRRRLIIVLAASSAVLAAVAIGLAALLAGNAAAPPIVDQPYYESTQALEGRADVIVRGTIISTREQDDNGFPETVARVAVEKAAKGQVSEGQEIEISYVTPGSGPETPEGLSRGGHYVFLLVSFPDDPAALVNTTQGYYTISGDEAAPAPGNDVALSPAVKQALDLR